ncbi:hypothetical protein BVI434_1460002 [Burkholderia vietnamiensis]|nr:hypothetical protein BVI434_1460002 [Burkholderia vietnamiensis]
MSSGPRVWSSQSPVAVYDARTLNRVALPAYNFTPSGLLPVTGERQR